MNAKKWLGTCVLAVLPAIAGCDQKAPNAGAGTEKDRPTQHAAADNTGRNTRDQDAATKTPMDQANSGVETRLAAEIRKAVMQDDSLSTMAKNCKIVVEKEGVVTLRGPVASQAEKDAIEGKARAVAGVTRVVNELEIAEE